MTVNPDWRAAARAFFDGRGRAITGRPGIDELCYIAGRDARVWRDPAARDELAASIVSILEVNSAGSVLEVGCAAGFLALLVAPLIGRYLGVDLAYDALAVARRLNLANAQFERADGRDLPFSDGDFDGAFCYDVFTNFPSIEDGIPLINEMLRVTQPGGKVLIGNIPDRARATELPDRVAAVGRDLEIRYGPGYEPPPSPQNRSLFPWLPRRRVAPGVPPCIVTYDFTRDSFHDAARVLNARVAILEVHSLNPYHGYRFNAVFHREAR